MDRTGVFRAEPHYSTLDSRVQHSMFEHLWVSIGVSAAWNQSHDISSVHGLEQEVFHKITNPGIICREESHAS